MASSQPDSFYSPASGAASSSSHSKATLSIDDITRLFSHPISEAASVLGVSTGVLKRLCRKNGIAKWPYRQLLSGKSLEDIRKEAEIEKLKDQKILKKWENAKLARQNQALPSQLVLQKQCYADQDHRIAFGQGFQQGNKIGSPNLDQLSPTKHIPTYMDEFKYGFPTTGLSSRSIKWWGSEETCLEESEAGLEENKTLNKGIDMLCSLRRKATEEMRDSIKGGRKNLEDSKLNKRQKMVLMKVFGSSLPDKWKNIVS